MTGSFENMVVSAENTIGAAEDNDIVINDRTVSRHHAVLYFDGQTFGIRDLRSTNGIVMNGFKVDDLKLRNGDSVSLGNAVMKIYF
jgi:pSer/pThr/pTyr-binding forkhead associated (FHA) protein